MSQVGRLTSKKLQLTEVNPYTELTITQKRYVEARLQGLNKKMAHSVAGFAPVAEGDRSSVYALEKNPKIRAAIRYLIRESTKSVDELTKSDVLTGMMDAVDSAATAGELVMAWREIGKLLGAYEPEKRILEVHDYSREELKTLSDKDLKRMAGKDMSNAVDGEFEEIPTDETKRTLAAPAEDKALPSPAV